MNPVRHWLTADGIACGADRQQLDDDYAAWRAGSIYRRGYSPYTRDIGAVTCPACRAVEVV